MTPDIAKSYNKAEWSDRPKARYKRVWYHSMTPERREEFLTYQRNYQRRKRREKYLEIVTKVLQENPPCHSSN
jgi:hypothetical protein